MSAHVIGFDKLKYEYSACPDFSNIYDEVSNGNHHEYVDFLVENGYLFKVTMSHPDSRSNPDGGSESGSGHETIYWDSLPALSDVGVSKS